MEYTVTITSEVDNDEHFKFTMKDSAFDAGNLDNSTQQIFYILMSALFSLGEIPTTGGRKTPDEIVDMMYEELHKDD